MRRARGVTLVEIMVSLAVITLGMLGIYRVMGTAIRGTTSGQRFAQAQARAQQVAEAIRAAPSGPFNVLDCLRGPVSTWATACEPMCVADLGGAQAAQACVYASFGNNPAIVTPGVVGQESDRSRQRYALVVDGGDETRSTWVRPAGNCVTVPCRIYDVQITVGWDEDGPDAPGAQLFFAGPPFPPGLRRVTIRQAVFQ